MKVIRFVTVLVCFLGITANGIALNYTTGTEQAKKFGVHEITLRGDVDGINPFTADVRVTFTPPTGQRQSVTVHAFYDGKDIWRARVYVSEAGAWQWQASSPSISRINGQTGRFTAADSGLRGRLLPSPSNPRYWIPSNMRPKTRTVSLMDSFFPI